MNNDDAAGSGAPPGSSLNADSSGPTRRRRRSRSPASGAGTDPAANGSTTSASSAAANPAVVNGASERDIADAPKVDNIGGAAPPTTNASVAAPDAALAAAPDAAPAAALAVNATDPVADATETKKRRRRRSRSKEPGSSAASANNSFVSDESTSSAAGSVVNPSSDAAPVPIDTVASNESVVAAPKQEAAGGQQLGVESSQSNGAKHRRRRSKSRDTGSSGAEAPTTNPSSTDVDRSVDAPTPAASRTAETEKAGAAAKPDSATDKSPAADAAAAPEAPRRRRRRSRNVDQTSSGSDQPSHSATSSTEAASKESAAAFHATSAPSAQNGSSASSVSVNGSDGASQPQVGADALLTAEPKRRRRRSSKSKERGASSEESNSTANEAPSSTAAAESATNAPQAAATAVPSDVAADAKSSTNSESGVGASPESGRRRRRRSNPRDPAESTAAAADATAKASVVDGGGSQQTPSLPANEPSTSLSYTTATTGGSACEPLRSALGTAVETKPVQSAATSGAEADSEKSSASESRATSGRRRRRRSGSKDATAVNETQPVQPLAGAAAAAAPTGSKSVAVSDEAAPSGAQREDKSGKSESSPKPASEASVSGRRRRRRSSSRDASEPQQPERTEDSKTDAPPPTPTPSGVEAKGGLKEPNGGQTAVVVAEVKGLPGRGQESPALPPGSADKATPGESRPIDGKAAVATTSEGTAEAKSESSSSSSGGKRRRRRSKSKENQAVAGSTGPAQDHPAPTTPTLKNLSSPESTPGKAEVTVIFRGPQLSTAKASTPDASAAKAVAEASPASAKEPSTAANAERPGVTSGGTTSRSAANRKELNVVSEPVELKQSPSGMSWSSAGSNGAADDAARNADDGPRHKPNLSPDYAAPSDAAGWLRTAPGTVIVDTTTTREVSMTSDSSQKEFTRFMATSTPVTQPSNQTRPPRNRSGSPRHPSSPAENSGDFMPRETPSYLRSQPPPPWRPGANSSTVGFHLDAPHSISGYTRTPDLAGASALPPHVINGSLFSNLSAATSSATNANVPAAAGAAWRDAHPHQPQAPLPGAGARATADEWIFLSTEPSFHCALMLLNDFNCQRRLRTMSVQRASIQDIEGSADGRLRFGSDANTAVYAFAKTAPAVLRMLMLRACNVPDRCWPSGGSRQSGRNARKTSYEQLAGDQFRLCDDAVHARHYWCEFDRLYPHFFIERAIQEQEESGQSEAALDSMMIIFRSNFQEVVELTVSAGATQTQGKTFRSHASVMCVVRRVVTGEATWWMSLLRTVLINGNRALTDHFSAVRGIGGDLWIAPTPVKTDIIESGVSKLFTTLSAAGGTTTKSPASAAQ